MKAYLRLICTTCKRTIDKPHDARHVTPDRCTITFNCQGRLVPAAAVDNRQIVPTPVPGIEDWRPRAYVAPTATIITAPPLNTKAGPWGQLVLAVRASSLSTTEAVGHLTVQVRPDTPRGYRQYTFRFDSSFTSVSGIESGVEKKTLRFTAHGIDPDQVAVYVNGARRTRGTGASSFQVDDGSGAIPPNMILFNNSVVADGIAQVDIIVTKAADATTYQLPLRRHDGSGIGPWENVKSVQLLRESEWITYQLFSLDVYPGGVGSGMTNIPINSIFHPGQVMVIDGPVAASLLPIDVIVLLTTAPVSRVDRALKLFIPLDTVTEDQPFKYHIVDGVPTLEVPSELVQPLFPSMRLTTCTIEHALTVAVAGVVPQVTLDSYVVVGPDA